MLAEALDTKISHFHTHQGGRAGNSTHKQKELHNETKRANIPSPPPKRKREGVCGATTHVWVPEGSRTATTHVWVRCKGSRKEGTRRRRKSRNGRPRSPMNGGTSWRWEMLPFWTPRPTSIKRSFGRRPCGSSCSPMGSSAGQSNV